MNFRRSVFFVLATVCLMATSCAGLSTQGLGTGLDIGGHELLLAPPEEQAARLKRFLDENPEIDEESKMQYLFTCMRDSQYVFIRNDVRYSGDQAMQWLRWKRGHRQYKRAPILTARDFVDRVADISKTTGRPYEVIMPGGGHEQLRTLLDHELEALEDALKKQPETTPKASET